MIIAIPREIKEQEYRVSVTPEGAGVLVNEGHRILVERSAGEGSGFADEDYRCAGAEIAERDTLFREAELVVKVKEPLPEEYRYFRDGQALFTFLHLASAPGLVDMLLRKNIAGFAYETLQEGGRLPLLSPMSEIAGKMAPVIAAFYLQKIHGGAGVLATGAAGVPPARFVILGAGTVGMSATGVALGLGADVTLLNRGQAKLLRAQELYGDKVKTAVASPESITGAVLQADVVIGAVYITGARAPKLVSRGIVSRMKKGSVIVDVAVDQGGCFETTRPVTHDNPVYIVDGVIHYTVANMPGAYPRTATLALTAQTLSYIRMLAEMGMERVVADDTPLKSALNTWKGRIMHHAVAASTEINPQE
ncbi:MAG: alanine dehydrogenase [Nitrospiraceae bacterium]|nr:MAG: alanine dehydrogenase [Nitrospiraceae bacterium]